ncbi:MAG: hypothetical protein K0U98_19395 [Deltaproteobacteria bacterium]|nr:hypothetical protein [Deltaproteobacteria bacterium]
MSPLDVERLLWELTANEGVRHDAEPTRIPDDDTLRAFRDDELNEDRTKEVETSLAASQQARERLAVLAGVPLSTPDPAIREAILDQSFPLPRTEPARRWWPAVAGLAAAAMVAAVVSFPLLKTPALPEQVGYEVSMTGLATERSTTEARELVQALPETRVRISVEPTGMSIDGLEIGLYRQSKLRLHRLIPDSHLRLETHRGAGLFEAAAADLVGAEPGIHSLYVVVAQRRDLPSEVVLHPGDDPLEALEQGSRRRAYVRQIKVESSTIGNDSWKERGR